MVRQEMYNRYGESAYEDGYRIYTTITRKVQQAAQQAVRNNVLDYDMRPRLSRPGECAMESGRKRRGTVKKLPIR
nr:penicillin-binding protein 1A [Salmonella sp. NCTC 7297]